MQVLLLAHVAGLGQKGELKEVSEGYYRNFLVPRSLASQARGGTMKEHSAHIARKKEKLTNMKESAEFIKSKIDGKTIEIKEKVSDTGHLYAKVSQKEVSEALKSEFKVDIPTKNIKMNSAIKKVGEVVVKIQLFKGITADITLNVSAK